LSVGTGGVFPGAGLRVVVATFAASIAGGSASIDGVPVVVAGSPASVDGVPVVVAHVPATTEILFATLDGVPSTLDGVPATTEILPVTLDGVPFIPPPSRSSLPASP
jgi:hypothetical protein